MALICIPSNREPRKPTREETKANYIEKIIESRYWGDYCKNPPRLSEIYEKRVLPSKYGDDLVEFIARESGMFMNTSATNAMVMDMVKANAGTSTQSVRISPRPKYFRLYHENPVTTREELGKLFDWNYRNKNKNISTMIFGMCYELMYVGEYNVPRICIIIKATIA